MPNGYMATSWRKLAQATSISSVRSSSKMSLSALRRQVWTQHRNWLKFSCMGHLTRLQNTLHELDHCLHEDEKIEMDHILDLMKQINDKWRQRQADMIVTIK